MDSCGYMRTPHHEHTYHHLDRYRNPHQDGAHGRPCCCIGSWGSCDTHLVIREKNGEYIETPPFERTPS